MTTEATRDEVLAWMVKTGCGYKRAAAHFDIPAERVKTWDRRAQPRPPGLTPPKDKGPKGGATPDGGGKPSTPARTRVALAEALGPDLRRDLRNGVKHAASFLAAPPNEDTDWQQRAHAARALEILLARVPDLMTFDERTSPQTTEATARDAEIGGVFGSAPASVTVLDGGRVAAKA